jgi:murein DD-endopeptidase MepM/ murein hydrolase activator NlpD
MHLDTIAVSAGDYVATTDIIGTVGHTGCTDWPGGCGTTDYHLHFELWAGLARG